MKVGDKVWVLCEVMSTDECFASFRYGSTHFRAKPDDCKPVEPEAVVKQSLTTDPNSPKILDSSSEPMREAFEAFMVKRYDPNREHLARNEDTQLYFDDETEMAWQAFRVGSKYQHSPLAPSPCMDGVDVNQFIEGVMDARGRTSDPVNPSHYKQGGIEDLKKARWYLDRLIQEEETK
jgi:hypothetical protein